MRSVKRGDIIVFRYPIDRDQDYVKRCVALAGDTVEMHNKRLYVNGKQVTGPFEHHVPNPEYAQDRNGNRVLSSDPTPGPWPLGRNAGEPDQPIGLWRHADPDVMA